MLSLENQPFRHVRHTISGRPSAADIGLAIEYSLQHEDVPILWDLRGLISDERLWSYGRSVVAALIRDHEGRMSGGKRAFVVADRTARDGIESLLGSLEVPWPWAVFWTEAEALEWLGAP